MALTSDQFIKKYWELSCQFTPEQMKADLEEMIRKAREDGYEEGRLDE